MLQSCLSQLHDTDQGMDIYEIKSVTTKHCSLRHTYRRIRSPTTKMKLTATKSRMTHDKFKL